MDIAIVTGSAGLIGSESVRFLAGQGFHVAGIDNDMRQYFFGKEASTAWNEVALEMEIDTYEHHSVDIRDIGALERIFAQYSSDIRLVVHTAAQPSHDWAAREPLTDFTINANGTLNLLEMTRKYCPGAVFVFTSTNKVYGDTPNTLPFIELPIRWELPEDHVFFEGIDETMSIDQSKHSLFGASKVAADVMVQEYGRYFGMKTACFRGGCLTGPAHSGTQLHGFLAYLMKCCITGTPYKVFGYKAKQVRDNIHSADLVNAFWHFYKAPRCGEVYNIGGGRQNSCSILEAVELCEKITGKKLDWQYVEENRIGDHIWYITNYNKFREHYPQWQQSYNLEVTLREIYVQWEEAE